MDCYHFEYLVEEEGKQQHIESAEENRDREFVDGENKKEKVSNRRIKKQVGMVGLVEKEEFHKNSYGKLGKIVEETVEKVNVGVKEVFNEELIFIKNEHFDDDYDENKPLEQEFDEIFIKEEGYLDENEREKEDDYNNVRGMEKNVMNLESGKFYDDCIVDIDKNLETCKNNNVRVKVDPLFQDELMKKDEECEEDLNYTEENKGEVDEKIVDSDQGELIMEPYIGKKSHKSKKYSEGFFQMGLQIVHKRIHTGEMPYKCTTCKKCFTRKDGLIRHERVHTGKKPYKCTTCEKCFSDKGNLNRHVRIHTENSRPYKCQTCNKCFTDSGHLTRHKRTHIGKSPYTCSICNEDFFAKRHLIMHLRIHSAKMSFKCATCSKVYSRERDLIRHERIHLQKQKWKV